MDKKVNGTGIAGNGSGSGTRSGSSVGTHRLTLGMRRSGTLTGITDALSFDEECLVLETELGLLQISGKELHVSRLSLESGEVDFEGMVQSIQYQEKGTYRKPGESIWKRLLQ